MGDDTKKKEQEARQNKIYTDLESQRTAFNNQPPQTMNPAFMDNYNKAAEQGFQDYGNIMSGYKDWTSNAGKLGQSIADRGAPSFSYNSVSAKRPDELNEAYGYLREAAPGYREFAATGGYSPQDIQELRARGISPIRAAYGNAMMELDRNKSGQGGYSPGYTAAVSRAQRELPGQMADATTNVNAGLASEIRQGKLAGLAGISGIGSEMGGLSSAESSRMLQADLANQAADLRVQELTEQGYNAHIAQQIAAQELQLSGLNSQTGLYGTTPGMASTFGNQALSAQQMYNQSDMMNKSYGLDLINAQMNALGIGQKPQGTPWWKTALSVAATAAPYVAMAASSRELKYDINEIDDKTISKKLKELPLYTWKYKGETTKHFGPIAEEFRDKFGVGDGKTLHLADVMGVILASQKESLAHA